jgi:D-arabinose 1-dehydrogenase-like Zn-dependent alcohol dehydrogenase
VQQFGRILFPHLAIIRSNNLCNRSPLVHEGLKAGDRVGIVGIGGLGHLAIQFASKLGYETVVFSTTESKREEALKFGASEFYATSGLKALEGIKPIDHLLITTSTTPDFAL